MGILKKILGDDAGEREETEDVVQTSEETQVPEVPSDEGDAPRDPEHETEERDEEGAETPSEAQGTGDAPSEEDHRPARTQAEETVSEGNFTDAKVRQADTVIGMVYGDTLDPANTLW